MAARAGWKPVKARPILKWAGGKKRILSEILEQLPPRGGTYYAPFGGGGAVFFEMARRGRYRKAVLGDRNGDLVELYNVVGRDVDALVEALKIHVPYAKDPEYFYALRASNPAAMDAVGRAARFIYLNKTCYNGLYRVNSKGGFNVPFGRHGNPRVLNEPLLNSASRVLCSVTIEARDFQVMVSRAGPGDAVYFDPPYHPLSPTSSFTEYAAQPFTEADHQRLARVFRECAGRGARVVLSNSDTDFTRSLYDGLDVHTVSVPRNINTVATGRGKVPELLVVAGPL